jgi:hypothetical protein
MWFLLRKIRDAEFDSSTNEKTIDTVREGLRSQLVLQ